MATSSSLVLPVVAGIATAAGAAFLVHSLGNRESPAPPAAAPAPVVIIRDTPAPAPKPGPPAPAPKPPSFLSQLLQGAPAIIDAAGRYQRRTITPRQRYRDPVPRYQYPDGYTTTGSPADTSWINDYWRGYLAALSNKEAANQLFRDNPTKTDLLSGVLDGLAKIPPRDPKGVTPRAEQLPAGVVVPALPGFVELQMISKAGTSSVYLVTGRSKHQLSPAAVARRGGEPAILRNVPAPLFDWYIDDNKVES